MTRIKGFPAGQTTRAASPAPGRLGRIGAWCYDHRRAVLLGWIAGVIAIIAVARAVIMGGCAAFPAPSCT